MSADVTSDLRTVPARRTWTWADSWRLELRAYCWMIGVTMPVSSMLVVVLVAILVPSAGFTFGESPGSFVASAVGWAAYADAFAVPCTFGAMIVALPFTYGVGSLMTPAPSRSAHVIATSALAGTLAAVPLVTIGRPTDPDWWLGFTIFAAVSIAAGSAGAIASWRFRSVSSRYRSSAPQESSP